MRQERIPGLDGIRAYAVALVFLVHFLTHYFNGVTGPERIDFDGQRIVASASLVETLARYFWASHYGVDLFFLLSGFLIFRIVSSRDFSYLGFLGGRFRRLYPALLVAFALYLLYMTRFWAKTFEPATIVANLLLLHGVWELQIQPIIVPTWSLTYEWLFYLAFPAVLLLPRARSRISSWHLALCGLLVLASLAPVGPHYMRLLMFILGAVLAAGASTQFIRKFAEMAPDAAVILVYVAANLLFVADQNWYRFIPVYLLTSAALVIKIVYGNGFLHKLFRLGPLCRLGNISYSFYLFHGLAIVAFCDHVGPHLKALPEAARFIALFAGAFALSVVAASLSYALLERPYFTRKGAKRPERRAEVTARFSPGL
jgi:exopolysaccharide production protein ExoZ